MALAVAIAGGLAIGALALVVRPAGAPFIRLPLTRVAEIGLPGPSSRFDYQSLDGVTGQLFISHLGASEIVQVDVGALTVTRRIGDVPGVHGVLVVPALHRLFATATDTNTAVTINEDDGAVLARSPTGRYPDGLAYDQATRQVWISNEHSGGLSVVDAATGQAAGSVVFGGQAGNVVYDDARDSILVADQSHDQLLTVDPQARRVTDRLALPGCSHAHGLHLAPDDRVAYVACDANATLVTVDLTAGRITSRLKVGPEPDVLDVDPGLGRLYVAAESGVVTVVAQDGRSVIGRARLAAGAHSVAVDPASHRAYFPLARGPDGHPALLVTAPA